MGETEALLTRLYEAFNRKDLDAVVTALHPDVSWPNFFGEGRLHGPEAVRDMWVEQFRSIDPEGTPLSFTHHPDGSLSLKVNSVIRTLDGKIFTDEINTHTYWFKDDRVVRMELT